MEYTKVSSREFQHNFSKYISLSKTNPIVVTWHGRNEVMLIDPIKFDVSIKLKKTKDIMNSKFIGMYKNDKNLKGKTTAKIADNLRKVAWYGKQNFS